MEITKTQDGSTLTITLAGRLDTSTSPQLEETIESSLDGINALAFDFTDLDYISSAGLRVLLSAQKKMNAAGTMVVKNVCGPIMEVFEMTGFADILTIE